MSSPQKITFGSSNTPQYNFNDKTYGYSTQDQGQGSYGTYQGGNTAGTTSGANYQFSSPNRDNTYTGQGRYGYSSGLNSSSLRVQPGTLEQSSYGAVKDIHHPAPQTKITFGNKVYTQSLDTQQPTTSYYAPQTYQTYQQPVEITSQPIREERRVEVQPQVGAVGATAGSKVGTGSRVQTPIDIDKTKKKKGGCPSWLWPLLGILALLALVLGLLFGLGVFGGGAGGEEFNPNMYTVIEQEAILSTDVNNNGVKDNQNYIQPVINSAGSNTNKPQAETSGTVPIDSVQFLAGEPTHYSTQPSVFRSGSSELRSVLTGSENSYLTSPEAISQRSSSAPAASAY